jgi:hypothetical protein
VGLSNGGDCSTLEQLRRQLRLQGGGRVIPAALFLSPLRSGHETRIRIHCGLFARPIRLQGGGRVTPVAFFILRSSRAIPVGRFRNFVVLRFGGRACKLLLVWQTNSATGWRPDNPVAFFYSALTGAIQLGEIRS